MKKIALAFFIAQLAAGVVAARGSRPVTDEPDYSGLVIRGEVTGLEVEREKDSVFFFVKLNVEFVNEGAEPIILFRPTIENHGMRYWLGGWSLALNEADAQNGRDIFGDGYWESVSGSPYYRDLASKLDVKTPPAEYTKILQPKESWKFADDFRVYFEDEKHTRFPEHTTWKDMQVYPPRLWLRVDYELSPWNVEYFKPALIRKLRRRWAKFGNILVENKKEGRYNFLRIASEPMLIDFSKAKPKEQSSTSDRER